MINWPDKEVRKAIFDLINNMVVNTYPIPCYDVKATNFKGKFYVLMSTQTNNMEQDKCNKGWEHSILLDIVTRYDRNTGSRVLADDIAQEILTKLNGLTITGFTIGGWNITAPNDLSATTDSETIHRKFIRYEFNLN